MIATTHGSWVQSWFTAAELLVVSTMVVVEGVTTETTGLFVEELTVDACLDTTKGQDRKCLACSPKAVSPSTQL